MRLKIGFNNGELNPRAKKNHDSPCDRNKMGHLFTVWPEYSVLTQRR